MTPDEFERRVMAEPDLRLSPLYWNVTLHEITGRAIWMLWIRPLFTEPRRAEGD